MMENFSRFNNLDVVPTPMKKEIHLLWAREDAAYLKSLATNIHRLNEPFYRDINTGQRIERNPGEMIALIHSELSEMLEGVRKNTMDDHLPGRKTEEVEAADVLIRLMDYCAYRGLDVVGAVQEKLSYNAYRIDHTHEARRGENGKKF